MRPRRRGSAEARVAVYAPSASDVEERQLPRDRACVPSSVAGRLCSASGARIARCLWPGARRRAARTCDVRAHSLRRRVAACASSCASARRRRRADPRGARDRRKAGPAPTPPPAPRPIPAPSPSRPRPSQCRPTRCHRTRRLRPRSPRQRSQPSRPAAWPAACWRPFAADLAVQPADPDEPPSIANSDAIVQRMVSLYGGPAKMTAGDADTELRLLAPALLPDRRRPALHAPLLRGELGHLPDRGPPDPHPGRGPAGRRGRRAPRGDRLRERVGVRPLQGALEARRRRHARVPLGRPDASRRRRSRHERHRGPLRA